MFELKQKRYFHEKHFILEVNGIKFSEKSLRKKYETFIPYNHINLEKRYAEKNLSWTLIILSILCSFYFLLYLSHLIKKLDLNMNDFILLFPLTLITFGILAWTLSEFKNVTYIFTYYDECLEFFTNNPNKKEFEAFFVSIKSKIQELEHIDEEE